MQRYLAFLIVACLTLGGCASTERSAASAARIVLDEYAGRFRHTESHFSMLEFPTGTTSYFGEARPSSEPGLCVADLMTVRHTQITPNSTRVDSIAMGSLYGIVGDLTYRHERDEAADARDEAACRDVQDTRLFFTVDGDWRFAAKAAQAFVAVTQPDLCDRIACTPATRTAVEVLAKEGLSHVRRCGSTHDQCFELVSQGEDPLIYSSVTAWFSLSDHRLAPTRVDGREVVEIE